MRTEKFVVDLPVLKQYIYSILYNATIQIKRIIPPRFHKYMKSDRTARQFINKSTLDEKLSLLAHFGVKWFLVLVDEEVAGVTDLKEILRKYKDAQKMESLKDIVNSKLFVTSSKEFITLLGLMAQTIHHQSYKMNLEYTRTGYHIYKWSRRFIDSTQTEETAENSILLAKTLLGTSFVMDRCDIYFQLRQVEVRVLLYLYTLKHTYVSMEQLWDYFNGWEGKVKITRAVRDLVLSQHIQRSGLLGERAFTITAIGIKIVHNLQDAVLQANNFR